MSPPDTLPALQRPLRVLFVCSGNTCRSPLAEALARSLALEMGFTAGAFRSAGTSAAAGMPASEGARRAALRHGLSLEEHRSTPLSRELVEWAQIVLAMGPAHLRVVEGTGGEGKGVLLGAYAVEDQEGIGELDHLAVPDPFGGDDRVYEGTYRTLERYVASALKRIRKEMGR